MHYSIKKKLIEYGLQNKIIKKIKLDIFEMLAIPQRLMDL